MENKKCECALEINKKGFGHASYCPLFFNDRIEDWEKIYWKAIVDKKTNGELFAITKDFIKQEIKKARGEAREELRNN